MKKTARILMLCLVLLMVFAACGITAPLPCIGENNGAAVAPQEETALRVMQFNVKTCDKGAKIHEIAEEIRAQSPQLVFLQELDWGTVRSKDKEILKLLAAELQMNYMFYPAISFDGGTYGIGILSVYPLENCSSELLDTRKGDEGRVLAKADVTVGNTVLHLFNTHLSFENTDMRLKQLDFLFETLPKGEPFILCGDFNVEAYEEFDRLPNTKKVNNPDTAFDTFAGDEELTDMFRGIDNIVLSESFSITHSEVVKTAVSDHHMLVADIQLTA